MKIQILLTGRAYPTDDSIPETMELAEGTTAAQAIATLQSRLRELETDELPPSCLVAVSGKHLGSVGSFTDQPLREGDEITLIAPVAGG